MILDGDIGPGPAFDKNPFIVIPETLLYARKFRSVIDFVILRMCCLQTSDDALLICVAGNVVCKYVQRETTWPDG